MTRHAIKCEYCVRFIPSLSHSPFKCMHRCTHLLNFWFVKSSVIAFFFCEYHKRSHIEKPHVKWKLVVVSVHRVSVSVSVCVSQAISYLREAKPKTEMGQLYTLRMYIATAGNLKSFMENIQITK